LIERRRGRRRERWEALLKKKYCRSMAEKYTGKPLSQASGYIFWNIITSAAAPQKQPMNLIC
jgi:hypothetical protein